MDIDTFITRLEGELDEVEPGTLTRDTAFLEMPQWSSLYALIIVAWVSTEFDVHLDDDDLTSIRTVEGLYNRIFGDHET